MSAPAAFWPRPLRQAVAAALDREALVDKALAGSAAPAYHMVPTGYPFATEPFRQRYGCRNLEQARRLLAELGYSSQAPFQLDLWHPPIGHYGSDDGAVWQALKEQIEETGAIAVRLHSRPWVEYVDSFLAGELPAFLIGWSPDFVDPENWLSPFAASTQSPDQGVNFHHAELTALLAEAAASAEPARRAELYLQIGQLYAEEVPTLPLYWEPALIAFRKGVKGVAIGAPFEFNYHVLSFEPGTPAAAGNQRTLVLGKTFPVQSLDANDAHARSDWEILKNCGESLVSYRPGTSELIPGVADLPEALDGGKSYLFELKEGLRFADGTPLVAENYVHAWRRHNRLRGQVSSLVRIYVEDVEALDDRRVVYRLKDRFGFFPAVAATPAFIPIHPEVFPADQINRFPERLDGVGRYRMVSHQPGDTLVLERNELCGLPDPARIDRVVIRYFPSSQALAQALVAGQVDIAWRKLGAREAQDLAAHEELEVVRVNTPLLRYLVFNHTFERRE